MRLLGFGPQAPRRQADRRSPLRSAGRRWSERRNARAPCPGGKQSMRTHGFGLPRPPNCTRHSTPGALGWLPSNGSYCRCLDDAMVARSSTVPAPAITLMPPLTCWRCFLTWHRRRSGKIWTRAADQRRPPEVDACGPETSDNPAQGVIEQYRRPEVQVGDGFTIVAARGSPPWRNPSRKAQPLRSRRARSRQ